MGKIYCSELLTWQVCSNFVHWMRWKRVRERTQSVQYCVLKIIKVSDHTVYLIEFSTCGIDWCLSSCKLDYFVRNSSVRTCGKLRIVWLMWDKKRKKQRQKLSVTCNVCCYGVTFHKIRVEGPQREYTNYRGNRLRI